MFFYIYMIYVENTKICRKICQQFLSEQMFHFYVYIYFIMEWNTLFQCFHEQMQTFSRDGIGLWENFYERMQVFCYRTRMFCKGKQCFLGNHNTSPSEKQIC